MSIQHLSKLTNSPWYSGSFFVQSSRMASMRSRAICQRCSKGMPWFPISSGNQPPPKPMVRRPCESRSREASSRAKVMTSCSLMREIAVPKLISVGNGGGGRDGNEGIVEAQVLLGEGEGVELGGAAVGADALAMEGDGALAVGGLAVPAAHGDVGVLGEVEGLEAKILGGDGELRGLHRVRRVEHEHTEFDHWDPPGRRTGFGSPTARNGGRGGSGEPYRTGAAGGSNPVPLGII